ncbi:MAG TPA: aldo/keto reductase [Chitinophagaceae bacterium]|nr:aldo/keto reductase [Chitinophagaceae bacterium]
MKYRKFGKTDLTVSEIGFGAWAIGGNAVVGGTPIGWGPADDHTSVDAIRKALDVGINFFDTADFYGLGHSEELIGKELRHNKEAIIATKVGHRAIDDTIQVDYSKEYIIQACEKSLRRMKRDFIDYYQLHSARMQHFEKEQCIDAMELLKKQGKTRHWGLSLNTFHPEAEANFLMEKNAAAGFQLVFNLINQKALPLMDEVHKKGYGVIARMPLQFGLLTGKFTEDSTFAKDDHRNFRLTKEIISRTNKILEQNVWTLCEKYNTSKTSLALSFILSFDPVSTVIPGIRTPQHAIDNTKDIIRLDKIDMEHLKGLYNSHWKEIVELMEKLG